MLIIANQQFKTQRLSEIKKQKIAVFYKQEAANNSIFGFKMKDII